jgi:two-component system, NtrC family, sensor kinase
MSKTSENSPIFKNLNALQDITYYTDSNGKIQEIYGNWFKLNSYNCKEIIGKTLGEFFNKNSINLHFERFNQCLINGKVIYEWSFEESGKRFYFQSALTRVEYQGAYGVIGVIRDITRQKEIELFYRELELSFRALTNSANYGIISINENKVIEYSNPAASAIAGYTEDELYGNPVDKIFFAPGEFYSFLELYIKDKFFNKDFDKSYNHISEIPVKKKNNEKISTEITISSYEIFNVVHFVILIQDITIRKNAETELLNSKEQLKIQNKNLEDALSSLQKVQDQLIHSEKMASIGQLTTGIAHEINNPLAFVSSNINRLNEYFNDINLILDKWRLFGKSVFNDNENSKLTELIEMEKQIDLEFMRQDFNDLIKYNTNGIERIKSIVQQLRGFSYSEEENISEENINTVMEETLSLVWNEIKFKVEIIQNYGDLSPVECNVGEMKQVFVNLLINAVNSVKEKGQIIIDTFSLKDYVFIRISDNGCGIPPEHINRIFDPFFTTKPLNKGTGLGLWICMSIVKKHDGVINVTSELGKGSTFELKLPLKQKKKEKRTSHA